MTIATRSTTAIVPTGIPAQTLTAIAMIGRTVTYQGVQFKLYSVEGFNWYTHLSTDGRSVICDFNMTESEYRRAPLAFLLPMGCKIGDGFGMEVRFAHVSRGISLAKCAI